MLDEAGRESQRQRRSHRNAWWQPFFGRRVLVDPETFNAIQPSLDRIAELVEQQLDSKELQRLIGELGTLVGKRRIASVSIVVDVFDEDRKRSLPLLTTGLSAFSGKEPFRTWGDSTPQRYVVEEGIKVVPHDRCPHCWQVWDFKLQNPSCPHCGITMGDKCKLLLDSDECPWCGEGKVTVAKPRCDKCRIEVDPQKVVWG
jgi:hypothetical protein